MRVAIFVDAGYLYAQGSAVLTGSRQRRANVELNQRAVMVKLRETASKKAGGCPLLRVYWYDGVLPQGPTRQQQLLADADNVKLRLGIINQSGRQKGVDSLIVTDLVELARNRAISDAALLSGDEDIRIGVQIAQSFGVRVHLIGIESAGGSQSRALMQESDTTTEWSKADVGEILTVKAGSGEMASPSEGRNAAEAVSNELELNEIASQVLQELTVEEQREVAELGYHDEIPKEIDGRLLYSARGRLASFLSQQDRHYLRNRFKLVARNSVAR